MQDTSTLQIIDPALCRPWPGQPRATATLTPASCTDLIDSLRGHPHPEIAVIVRPLPEGDTHRFEIICGTRRHFAVTHLRAQGHKIGLLIAPRALDDEAAFRLADLENRNRSDISEYARACGYADALERHYGGVQTRMAARMGVKPAWLSRYLVLARLPDSVVAACADPGDLRERHARALSKLLADADTAPLVLAEAARLAETTPKPTAPQLVAALRKAAGRGSSRAAPGSIEFRRMPNDRPVIMQRRAGEVTLRFEAGLSRAALCGALNKFLSHNYK